MLSRYSDLVLFFLTMSLATHCSTAKLLSVLAQVFTELAQEVRTVHGEHTLAASTKYSRPISVGFARHFLGLSQIAGGDLLSLWISQGIVQHPFAMPVSTKVLEPAKSPTDGLPRLQRLS